MKRVPSSILTLAVLSLSLTVCSGAPEKKELEKKPLRKTKTIIEETKKAIDEVRDDKVKIALNLLLELDKKTLTNLRKIPKRFRRGVRRKRPMRKGALKRPGARRKRPAGRRLLGRKGPEQRKGPFMRRRPPLAPLDEKTPKKEGAEEDED